MSEVAAVVSDEGLGGVVPFGRGLRRLGFEPLLLTGPVPPQRLVAWGAHYDRIVVLEDPYDPAVLAAAAHEAAAGRRLRALLSCYDGLVLPAARAAAALGLPHPALEGLARARNKLASRRTTLCRGLPTPRFAPIAGPREVRAAAEQVGFPAVLKPTLGMASHLVRRVDDLAALEAAYADAAPRLERSFAGNYRSALGAGAAPPPFLLEEHLGGVEHSAEVLVRGGTVHRIALFHKFLVDPEGFLECGFTRPSFGREHREEAIWRHIEEVLSTLGVDDAAAHVEVMDTPAGPRLVEVNAGRAGGQLLVAAVRESAGIDLIAEILALALGGPRPLPVPATLAGRVSTLTVFPPGSGRLEALVGLDRLAALPGVVRVVPFCAPGDILDAEDKEIFAVNLLVAGGEQADLRALHAEACRTVELVLRPVGEPVREVTA